MMTLLPVLMLTTAPSPTTEFDLLIRGGHVVDPKNGLDARLDVGIRDGRIAAVQAELPPDSARRVVNAEGLYVVPGLIDLHAHVFYGTEEHADYSNGFNAVPPDNFSFRSGVTTLVDVGGAGWRNFDQFKTQVIDRAKTRVLAFLNIVGSGMKGGPIEQNLNDMDARLTAMRVKEYPGTIVGVKVAHYSGPEWDPVDRAVQAGEMSKVPVMVDFGRNLPPLSLGDLLLVHLRSGDIFTHAYAHLKERMPIVGSDGKVEGFAWEARKRGIVFDVGHGAGSFVFRQVVPAMSQGFRPDTISTDLHTASMNAGMKDLLNVMSKFLNLGMEVTDVIERTTWNPARVIAREDLGHLSPGAVADLTILSLKSGSFGFLDSEGSRMAGTRKLECELTVREGRVVWDLNGLAATEWTKVEAQ